jgi:hypothetical protein
VIVATGSLGTAPYTYSIDGTTYQSSGTFAGLTPGFYTVYIKDNRGCISTTGLTVGNTSGLLISSAVSTPSTCGNANGTITITATGGTAPLQYSINGITFQSSNIFTGVFPGTYTVTVTDAGGCITTRAVVVANTNGPQTLTATILHAACGTTDLLRQQHLYSSPAIFNQRYYTIVPFLMVCRRYLYTYVEILTGV